MTTTQRILLIHGPVREPFLREALTHWTYGPIVITTYVEHRVQLKALLTQYPTAKVEVHYVEDLMNPGFFNLNRQLLLVNKGLEAISNENAFVIKLRSDQIIDFKKFFQWLEHNAKPKDFEQKYLVTNCYTRIDRPYHPSDMLMAGLCKILKKIYDIPMLDRTDLDTRYQIERLVRQGANAFELAEYWPESYFFLNFLRQSGWDVQNTFEDSRKALKTFLILVNANEINYRYEKFKDGKKPILPYYLLNFPPTRGGPIENARCYYQSDFQSWPSLGEFFYKLNAVIYWTGCELKRRWIKLRPTYYKYVGQILFPHRALLLILWDHFWDDD